MLPTLFGVLQTLYVVQSREVEKDRGATFLFPFAGGWPGTGLLLMRLVIGFVLIVRASLLLWRDPP